MGAAFACFTTADAAFSTCRRYRWWLRRQWQPQRPTLVFVGLNPSRADAERDDPTLRRLVGFARQWGYGSLLVLNLFARISPSPAVLMRCSDPVGPENDRWLLWTLGLGPAAIWLGWGNRGALDGRDRTVLTLLNRALSCASVGTTPELLCLGWTAAGQPRHPLYVPAGTKPRAWGILG